MPDTVATRRPAYRPAILQLLVVAGIGAGTALLAFIGLASLARLFFLGAGITAAALYIRHSPWLYLTLTFWFWTLTPLLRRIIDYNSAFDPVNIVLAAPNLMTLFMLKDILNSRELLQRREAAAGLLVAVPIGYGLVASFVRGDVIPGAVAAADWAAPLFYYFYIIALWRRIDEAEPQFRAFLTLNMIVIVAYGFQQYLAPTAWDAAWILDSGLIEYGPPLPYQIRLFGSLNAPALLATWLGTLLLLALHFRTWLIMAVLPATAILLLLTLVRSIVGTTVLGLVAALLLSKGEMFRAMLRSSALLLFFVVTISAVVFALDPDTADRITDRFDSISRLENDTSALARRSIYAEAPGLIDANPVGMGIGAVGRGAVAGDGDTELVIIDAGPLAIYLALGWVAGSIYIAGIATVVAQALLLARRSGSPAALALAATVLANMAGLAFVNVTGFYAAIAWLCAGYAVALDIHARQATPVSPYQWRPHWLSAAPAASLPRRDIG